MAALLGRSQVARALDDAAEMFVRLTARGPWRRSAPKAHTAGPEGSCPRWWCRSSGPWQVGSPCQVASDGRLTGAVSLTVPSVSKLI